MSNQISQQLRLKRHVLGLSQVRLAQLSGVAQQNISAYEQGDKMPSVQTLAKLARHVGEFVITAELEGTNTIPNDPTKQD